MPHRPEWMEGMERLERFQFRRNHTNERALRLKSSTGSVKVGIALVKVRFNQRPATLNYA